MTLARHHRRQDVKSPRIREAEGPSGVLGDGVAVLTPTEAWSLFDAQARKHLGMSAEEFELRWERGDLRARQESLPVRRVLAVRVPKP
ncbi:MAG TPA: hypothetical protein PKI89_07385 [Tepidiformaceae bacterium]|nr:hypothetical protein [Tepidiformaceae bacterium]HNO65288.1 hypothetical protein [Tepidiformaceae bacterium]